MLAGADGVGVASLSSFAREVKRLEVIVGRGKWRFSLTCLATGSADSCVGLPRLYETVVQEGQREGWEEAWWGLNREAAIWRLGRGHG
jgi:hypothetical protein